MRTRPGTLGLWLLACCAPIVQTATAEEPRGLAVLELGGAAEWPTRGASTNFGGTIAAEVMPIEKWLEIEAGIVLLGMDEKGSIVAIGAAAMSPAAKSRRW